MNQKTFRKIGCIALVIGLLLMGINKYLDYRWEKESREFNAQFDAILQNVGAEVLSINKKYLGKEYDVIIRDISGPKKAIVEEVKNGAFDLEEFDESIKRLKEIKGQMIDNVEIIDTRFTVSYEYFDAMPESAKLKAAQNGISIITFERVK